MSLWFESMVFYLVEDKKPFFTQYYSNGKDAIVCGHEIPMQVTLTTSLALEKIATTEVRIGYSVLLYGRSGLMNNVFNVFSQLAFFPQN